MTELSRDEQFDTLEGEYEGEDLDTIQANRKAFADADSIVSILETSAGKSLIKSTKDEITKSISLLIETRKARYVSDLEANLNILNKLIGAKKTKEAIGAWLDSLSEQ